MKLIHHNIMKVAESMTKKTFDQGIIKGLKGYRVTDKVTMYLPVSSQDGITQIG